MIAGAGAIVAPTPGLPTSSQPLPSLDWKFSQVFGERAAGEEVQEGVLSHFPCFGSCIVLHTACLGGRTALIGKLS